MQLSIIIIAIAAIIFVLWVTKKKGNRMRKIKTANMTQEGRERMTMVFNPCEGIGVCPQSSIQKVCANVMNQPALVQDYGFNTMSDCMSDPRMMPPSCQPINTRVYCRAYAKLGGDYHDCVESVTNYNMPIGLDAFHCAQTASTMNDFEECVDSLPTVPTPYQCSL